MNGRNNIRLLYVLRFFHNLVPAYVIERLYWEARGMSVQDVVYTELLYAAAILLFEVPSGYAADRWSRKRLLLADAVTGCLEFLLLLHATAFWYFALVVVLAGIGRSASSGAENALLYDSLRAEGREVEFEKQLGRLNACDIAATVLAALLGSVLAARFGFALNYAISLGSMVVSLAAALALAEPPRSGADAGTDDDGGRMPLRRAILDAFRFFARRPGVCLVLAAAIAAGSAIGFVDEFWQLYLERLRIPVAFFGLFSAAIFLLRMPGSLIAYRLASRYRVRTLIGVALAVLTASLAALAAFPGPAGLAALGLACLAYGLVEPLSAGYLHHRIDSPMRATIDSFQSLAANAVMILAGLGFGYFS